MQREGRAGGRGENAANANLASPHRAAPASPPSRHALHFFCAVCMPTGCMTMQRAAGREFDYGRVHLKKKLNPFPEFGWSRPLIRMVFASDRRPAGPGGRQGGEEQGMGNQESRQQAINAANEQVCVLVARWETLVARRRERGGETQQAVFKRVRVWPGVPCALAHATRDVAADAPAPSGRRRSCRKTCRRSGATYPRACRSCKKVPSAPQPEQVRPVLTCQCVA